MQIKNGVYVPVELDWNTVKGKIDAEVAHDPEFKFFPAGTPVSSDGDLKYVGGASQSPDTTNVVGILSENLWVLPDHPVIKSVNALVGGDVILDVDIMDESGPDFNVLLNIMSPVAAELLSNLRFYLKDGSDLRAQIGG